MRQHNFKNIGVLGVPAYCGILQYRPRQVRACHAPGVGTRSAASSIFAQNASMPFGSAFFAIISAPLREKVSFTQSASRKNAKAQTEHEQSD
jgi:hypothetical protein